MERSQEWSLQETLQYRISIWNPRWMFEMHKLLYCLTGGRVGGTMRGIPVLLLTTKGRKTGKERTKPLMYLRDGNNYIIVASNAGQDSPPAWFSNLRANPRARIQVSGDRLAMNAEIASGAERERLWQRVCALNPFYAAYQERTQRPIDVMILRPES